MKACGIITEYNPFHNGHQYHLDQAKQVSASEVIVNVMSGNFVQRGEAAIVDKWTRAQAALEAGCDVVIELPYIYATQAAHKFAKGAINALVLAQVSHVVFGSETNDLAALQAKAKIKVVADKTKSTNAQYMEAMGSLHSNDILGINYLIALQGCAITPLTIQRTNAYQSLFLTSIASASAIREAVYAGTPYEVATPMRFLEATHRIDHYYPFIQQQLLALSAKELSDLFLVDEGIENHLKKCAKKAQTYEAFLALAITKKYPKTRIQRTLMHILNHVSKQEAACLEEVNFIRVLAFNQKGQAYLQQLKKQGVHIVTRWQDLPKAHQAMEWKATFHYALVCTPQVREALLKREVGPPIRL